MARKPVVTSVDVARRAGVSQSAVSRVFARGPTESGVSVRVRERVLEAARELGYRPNAIARSLITRRSHVVALLFSYLDNPFYAVALERLCLALQSRGYRALVLMVPDTVEDAAGTFSDLLEHRVDGIVTASVELSSELCEYCLDRGIPIVMFNRTQDDSRIPSVTTDNVGGGRLVARHLLARGHERIALLAGWERASTSRDRERGFLAELAAAGVAPHARAVGHFDLTRAAAATRALFAPSLETRPDALFVVNDYMAIVALDVIRHELGLGVPGDVSVVGFDDIPAAARPSYALTTMRQPLEAMVEAAVDLLLAQIEEPGRAPAHVVVDSRLVERRSTR